MLAAALALALAPAGWNRPAAAAASARTVRPAAPAPTRPASGPHPREVPRLVVLLVVDQLRSDYLDRLAPRFGPDGFKRLLREGTRFTGCAYDHALTETAPGHATLATGTNPDRHGIISNDWYDRETKKVIAAVDDPDSPLVGASGAGVSPRRLMVDTLGDTLRLATRGGSRVWSLAGKDRSAVFSAGRGASGAIWYDIHSGLFVTSRWYATSLPPWAARLDAERPADRLLKDTGAKDYDFLRGTPQFHDLLFDCARRMVAAEHLGEDTVPDLLIVGLSGVDILGHQVGPYDKRIEALIVRLDAQIGTFLKYLDERVGVGRTIVALSADHGVAPTIDQAKAAGLRPDRLDRPRLLEAMQQGLAARTDGRPAPRLYGDNPMEIWFEPQELDRAGLSREAAAEAAGEAALAVAGIYGFVSEGRASVDDATRAAYAHSRFAGRSPDLFLVPAPYAIDDAESPATHGSPWSYDRRVPLILAGPMFRTGVEAAPCTPADLAPTLAAALHIPPPSGATGHVLAGALR